MGKGSDIARQNAPVHAAVMDDFKDQLLIVFLKRIRSLGGSLSFPLGEVDDTGQDILAFRVEDRVFHFELRKKD